MVYNATFNNISVISQWSKPKKTTALSQVSDCIGSYKSIYHMTTTAPLVKGHHLYNRTWN